MKLFDNTLRAFLQQAASTEPTPGGGSVSAVAAALAAAMVAMVAGLTLGKRGYEEARQVSEETLTRMGAAVAELEILGTLDIEVFDDVMAAWRLPSETPAQKAARADEISVAAERATQVPLRICRCCLDILAQAACLAPRGTKSAISDVGVGAHLADAALNGAMLSVDANLALIGDETVRLALLREKTELLRRAGSLKQVALAEIGRRL